MIFVTVGTNEAPFDRLLSSLSGLGGLEGHELVVQHGASGVRPPGATCVESLPYDEVVETMRRAAVVVTHAGVGSVLTALTAGKRPVVTPRLRRFGEAVDDHQLEFARHVGPIGLVTVVEDLSLLPEAVLAATQTASAPEIGPSRRLVEELRQYLDSALGEERYSR